MTEANDIVVEVGCQCDAVEFDVERFEDLARMVVGRFCEGKVSVSIAVVDDAGIIEVHKQFLDKETTTDVISFDLSDDDGKVFEVVVNAEQARRQADKRGHGADAELALYVTHGLLHNLGFDDMQEQLSQEMHAMEDELLQLAGFGVIYSAGDAGL